MKCQRAFCYSSAAFLVLFAAVAGKPALGQTNTSEGEIKCMKRESALEPPSLTLPTRRPVRGKERELPRPRKLKPVCPEGEVPVTAFPSDRHFIKGNPMIGNYAAPGPAHALPGELVNRLLLPFDEVYWKRAGRPAPPKRKPAKDDSDPPCDGVAWFGSCFYYATASELRVADGGGTTFTIEDPTLDNSGGGGGHSIGEIAVMGTGGAGAGLDDVEMGFSVSPDQFGDSRPHLFVYHWINGNETCYNTCAWNQYSNTYSPGMDLTPLVGQPVYIGWVHFRNAWWGWFNDQWLGYINDSEWNSTFTRTAQIQWYGEVASNNGIPQKPTWETVSFRHNQRLPGWRPCATSTQRRGYAFTGISNPQARRGQLLRHVESHNFRCGEVWGTGTVVRPVQSKISECSSRSSAEFSMLRRSPQAKASVRDVDCERFMVAATGGS